MISLIKNEIIKLLSRKKTLVTTIAFLLLIGVTMFGSYKEDQNRKKYNSPEYRIQMLEQSIEQTEKNKTNTNIPEQDKKMFDEQIAQNKEEIKRIKESTVNGKIDWKKDLTNKIDQSEKMLKEPGFPEAEKERVNQEISKYKYLLNNNIKYDEDSLNAFNFTNMLFMILGAVFLAVGVLVFSADMVSGEYTPPTMKVLLTQPVSRAKVLLSKFIAVLVTSVVMIVTIEVISFVIMGLIFGFGSFNYPMFVGTRYQFDLSQVVEQGHPLKAIAGTTYMITRGVFLFRVLLFEILFITACVSFAFMLSTLLKSSMVSVSLSIVVVIALTILSQIPSLKKVSLYMFSNYGDILTILQGQMALRYQNPIVTVPFGITVLLVWTIVCYAISHFVFIKRDLLI